MWPMSRRYDGWITVLQHFKQYEIQITDYRPRGEEKLVIFTCESLLQSVD